MVKIEIKVIIQVNNFKGLNFIGYNFKEPSFIGLQVNNLEFVEIKKLKVANKNICYHLLWLILRNWAFIHLNTLRNS